MHRWYRHLLVASVVLAMLATFVVTSAAAPSGGVEGVSYPEPLVTELPDRRGDGDGFEMLDHGDLNADGIADLAALRHDSEFSGHATSVLALLGDGDGTFTTTYELDITDTRNIDGGVVIDLLDGDEHADLASATSDTAGLLLHPGNGDGTFGATVALGLTAPAGAATVGPELLRSADIDDDGHVDLVAGFSTGVSILRSDGAGGFETPVAVVGDVGALADVDLADLDGDDLAELVLVGDEALQVLGQESSGDFAQTERLDADASYTNGFTAAVVGEFSGDGDLDVVAVRGGHRRNPDGVGLFVGGGDGTLTPPTVWEQTPSRRGVLADSNDLGRDLDGDTHTDALFSSGGATVVAVLGDGTGGLDTHAWLVSAPDADLGDNFTGGQWTSHAVAADTNGDDVVDLVVGADGGVFASVNVLLADPDEPRRFSAAQVFRADAEYDDGFSVNLVEFTGDDHLDIVTIGRGDGLHVAAGRGDGTFEDAVTVSGEDPCYWGYLDRAGDFDGDGNADVVCHATDPFVYFGNGGGGIRGVQSVQLGDPVIDFHLTTDVLPVDFDGTGGDELVVASTRTRFDDDVAAGYTDTTQVTVLRHDDTSDALEVVASVDLGPPQERSKDSTNGLVAGDFNDDDDLDLAIWFTPEGTDTLQRAVVLGDGTGGLGAPTLTATTLPNPVGGLLSSLASRAGDVDGDGNPDIVSVTTVGEGVGVAADRVVVVELGSGDGTFAAPTTAAATTAPDRDFSGMALADIDVDGHLDVVIDGDRTLEVHLGDGDGGFAAPVHLQRGGSYGTSVAVGDVDGDGRPDIVADAGLGAAVHRTGGDVVAPTVNLTVEEVVGPTGPVRAGDDAEVTVTVRNTGTVATTGTWVDEVVLDAGEGPVVIGTAPGDGPLAPGEAYTTTVTGSWPATLAGTHDLRATTDARDEILEEDEDDNTRTSSVTTTVDEVPYDLDVVGTVGADRFRLHRIVVDGDAAVLGVSAPDTVTIATATGTIPGVDQLTAVGDERVLRTGEHYLLVAGPETGDAVDYELRLTRLEAGIRSVAPSVLRRGPGTFEIRGAGFDPGTAVELRRGETTIPADTVQRVSSTLLLVGVDLAAADLGGHDVIVRSDGVEHVLADGIQVVDAAPPRFEVFVSVPERARLFRTSPVQVTILNAGGVDALSPVVRLSTDRARLGRHDDGRFDTRAIDFLAVADDGSRVLAPGESAHVSARFDPDPDVDPGDDMGFTARAYGVTNVTPWGWTIGLERHRPEGLPDEVWAAAAEAFRTVVGDTAGSYGLALHDVHADLAEVGLATDRGDRMVPRIVARAVAGVPDADLFGTVRDDAGPLVERDVLLLDQAGGITEVTTTLDGDYAAHGVAPGTHDVHVRDAVPTPAAVVELPRSERLDLTVSAPVSLAGRVLYPDGRGAGRIPVLVERVGQEGVDVGTAQTDASGRYVVPSMPTGELRIVATAPGHAPGVTIIDAPDPGRVDVPDLSVEDGLPVAGRVTDDGGAPVAGALVIVRSPEGRAAGTATSAADGGYEVLGIPEGPIEVAAVHPTAGQGTAAIDLTAPGGTADVELLPGGALVGTVTSSGGGPLADAVVLSDALRGADPGTAADGSFRVDGVPAGDSRVEVRAPGHVPTSLIATVASGTDTDLGEIELAELGVLPVAVTGADDTPLGGVPVTATLVGGLGGTVRTGADGTAVLNDLVPGRYIVQAGTIAGPDSTRAVVDVVGGDNVPLELGADLTQVRGVIRTATGVVAPGAEVAAIVDGEPLLLTTTDASGAYSFLVEPGTDVHLRASSVDDHVAVVRDVAVGTTDLVRDLRLGASALDVDVDGPASVDGVELVLRLDDVGEVVRVRTDTDGTARFAGLPASGGWTILAAGEGHAPQLVTGTLSVGATAVPITLLAGRSVSGTVLDGDGAPVLGSLVGTVDPGTGESILTTTDDDGDWTLGSLSSGLVDLTAADGVDVAEVADVDLTAGLASGVALTLDGAGTNVEGVVTDGAGTPLMGRMVQLVRDDQPVAQTSTGSDGRYALDGVPAGAWTLVAALGGGPSLQQPIVVPDGSPPAAVEQDLVMPDAVGWTLHPPFELAPPGNVTAYNASLVSGVRATAAPAPAFFATDIEGDTTFLASALPDVAADPAPAGGVTVVAASGGGTVTLAGFTEAISGLPRPQKNAWAQQNETAWRANKHLAEGDCPPVVYSLESALSQSERDMNQAFYDLQASYGAVQDVYTAGMGEALASGAYTGLKTWVTVSGMAQSAGAATTGAQTAAANQLASVGLPIIDTTAGAVGNAVILGDSGLSIGSAVNTTMGVAGGAAGIAGKNGVSNGLGAVGIYQDWSKFRDDLGKINESQINTLISYSLTEDRYLAAVERHQQLTNSFASATVECDPDPPEEEPERDDDDGPDDDGGGGGGGGGGGDDPPTPPDPPSDDPRNPRQPGPDGRGEATSQGGQSADPNEITGPPGVGEAGWIAAPADLGYQISYENMPEASLAATIVTVTTELDPDTDWTTFELGDLGWGRTRVDVPDGVQEWSGRIALPGRDDVVDVEAGLDPSTGEVTWTMTTIDPATGLITDGDGYLPPNDAAACGLAHCGEGFVDYSVGPASTVTGTEITAQAEIVFDVNAPIVTNTWRNTIDEDRPRADVAALPAESVGTTLQVAWDGTDLGSGPVRYDLYAQVDGSEIFLYRQGLDGNEVPVPVEIGRRYGFAVLATDAVGLAEDLLAGAEQTTLVVAAPDPDPDPDGPDPDGPDPDDGGGGGSDGNGGGGDPAVDEGGSDDGGGGDPAAGGDADGGGDPADGADDGGSDGPSRDDGGSTTGGVTGDAGSGSSDDASADGDGDEAEESEDPPAPTSNERPEDDGQAGDGDEDDPPIAAPDDDGEPGGTGWFVPILLLLLLLALAAGAWFAIRARSAP